MALAICTVPPHGRTEMIVHAAAYGAWAIALALTQHPLADACAAAHCALHFWRWHAHAGSRIAQALAVTAWLIVLAATDPPLAMLIVACVTALAVNYTVHIELGYPADTVPARV
jgi:hypothetical protein